MITDAKNRAQLNVAGSKPSATEFHLQMDLSTVSLNLENKTEKSPLKGNRKCPLTCAGGGLSIMKAHPLYTQSDIWPYPAYGWEGPLY